MGIRSAQYSVLLRKRTNNIPIKLSLFSRTNRDLKHTISEEEQITTKYQHGTTETITNDQLVSSTADGQLEFLHRYKYTEQSSRIQQTA